MLSTTTIIYIVIALVILFFIYNSMKKCEGLPTGSLTKLPIKTCTINEVDFSTQLQALENKIKTTIGTPANNFVVNMKIVGNKYYIEFLNCVRLDLPKAMTNMNADSVRIGVYIDNKKNLSGIVDIGPELKAIKTAAAPGVVQFDSKICKGCADSIIINIY